MKIFKPPTLQVDFSPTEPPGKPMNTGVGSLSPSPGDLPDPGTEPGFPTLQADSLPAELPGKPSLVIRKTNYNYDEKAFQTPV